MTIPAHQVHQQVGWQLHVRAGGDGKYALSHCVVRLADSTKREQHELPAFTIGARHQSLVGSRADYRIRISDGGLKILGYSPTLQAERVGGLPPHPFDRTRPPAVKKARCRPRRDRRTRRSC